MKVLIFQHVPFEEPGGIFDWAVDRGHEVMLFCLWKRASPIQPQDYDVLIVLGGPMSANDEDLYPWLKPEKDFIRAMMRAGKPVLGICLGAQLIASALGARVYPAVHKEIGWFAVNILQAATDSLVSGFPSQFTPMHWHGETFDLPEGAIRLMETKTCPNQAFQFADQVLGLQFHLEMTSPGLRALIETGLEEIDPTQPYQQSADQIWSLAEEHITRVKPLLYKLLDRLTAT